MGKEGVLVSLKAWIGDVEPYDFLDEVRVQIRGVPPKCCKWRMFRQIASSLGKLLEVDWNSLFGSFFGMVRIKIACKDATKIPSKMLFEMKNNLYVIQFKVERSGAEGSGNEDEDNGGGDDNLGNEDDNGMDEIDHEAVPDSKGGGKKVSDEKKDSNSGSEKRGSTSSGRKIATWASLFQDESENLALGAVSWVSIHVQSC
jgi:hypothetical protein